MNAKAWEWKCTCGWTQPYTSLRRCCECDAPQPRLGTQGRALTPEHKRAVIERIYAAWLKSPQLRLGQLLENSTSRDLYDVEDDELAEAAETWSKK